MGLGFDLAAIITMVMTAIIRMHRPGLAVAKHVMGIKAKASRVAFGLAARQHSASPKAASARMISRALEIARSRQTMNSVMILFIVCSF